MPVPREFFGIHVHRFHNPTFKPTLDFGAWRLWGAGVEWARLQPEPERWDFRRLDLAVALSSERHQEVLLTLGQTPTWASRNPQYRGFFFPGSAAPPSDIDTFERYVYTVAERYRGRVRQFEVWNEPASGGMFQGTVDDMVELTKAAARAVKRVDSTNVLVCPSPAKFESLVWFEQFLAASGAVPCDIIAYHFYTDTSSSDDRLELIQRVAQLLAKYGESGKPIWDTESGFALANANEDRELPGNLARGLILSWAAGIGRHYWYAWDHSRLGFIDPASQQPRAVVGAMHTVMDWMLGARLIQCARGSEAWECEFVTAKGGVAHIFWATPDREGLSAVAPCGGRVRRLTAETTSVRAGSLVVLTAEPLMLECRPRSLNERELQQPTREP